MKKKHILFIILAFVMVLTLSGCSKVDKTVLPISNPGEGDGWFVWILVRPIAWLIDKLSFGGFLAFGIIFTTLLVRTMAWPVYAKTNDMSLKMNLAQPEMARIQTKYANRKDPVSQQKMQREMMAVWKKYKINPLGCLVAPLIQFPLFMAMYNAVQRYPNKNVVDETGAVTKGICTWFKHVTNGGAVLNSETGLYEAVAGGDLKTKFCGIDLMKGISSITDLAKISNWIYVILPILVGVTMIACQLVSQMKPKYAKKAYPNQDNSQAKQTEKMMKFMMYFMSAMMVLMSFRSGTLALYWIIGNLYTIAQTLINRKMSEKRYEKMQKESSII